MAQAPVTQQQGSTPTPTSSQQQGQMPAPAQQPGQPIYRDWAAI